MFGLPNASNSLANFNCYKTLFMFKTIASLSLAYLFPPQFPKPYCSSGLRRLLAFVIKNWPIANTMIMSMKLSLCSISLGLFVSFSPNQSRNREHNDRWGHATQPFQIHCIQSSENEFNFFFFHKFVPRNSLLVNQQKLQVNEQKKSRTILSTYS